jgi:hypothetical protein
MDARGRSPATAGAVRDENILPQLGRDTVDNGYQALVHRSCDRRARGVTPHRLAKMDADSDGAASSASEVAVT